MFSNDEKAYLLKYAGQRWGLSYNDMLTATAEEMTKTAEEETPGVPSVQNALFEGKPGESDADLRSGFLAALGLPGSGTEIEPGLANILPDLHGAGVKTPGELTPDQAKTLGISGLGAGFGAGALALTRMAKARQAAEAAALAAKGGGALGKLRALLG